MNSSTDHDIQSDKEDIIFECPQCGKSLEIDAKGAGYMIVCPDCGHEIQVPSWKELEDSDTEALTGSEEGSAGDDEQSVDTLLARIEQLERAQRTDNICFKRLGDEITLIQAALDRITEIVESRKSEG